MAGPADIDQTAPLTAMSRSDASAPSGLAPSGRAPSLAPPRDARTGFASPSLARSESTPRFEFSVRALQGILSQPTTTVFRDLHQFGQPWSGSWEKTGSFRSHDVERLVLLLGQAVMNENWGSSSVAARLMARLALADTSLASKFKKLTARQLRQTVSQSTEPQQPELLTGRQARNGSPRASQSRSRSEKPSRGHHSSSNQTSARTFQAAFTEVLLRAIRETQAGIGRGHGGDASRERKVNLPLAVTVISLCKTVQLLTKQDRDVTASFMEVPRRVPKLLLTLAVEPRLKGCAICDDILDDNIRCAAYATFLAQQQAADCLADLLQVDSTELRRQCEHEVVSNWAEDANNFSVALVEALVNGRPDDEFHPILLELLWNGIKAKKDKALPALRRLQELKPGMVDWLYGLQDEAFEEECQELALDLNRYNFETIRLPPCVIEFGGFKVIDTKVALNMHTIQLVLPSTGEVIKVPWVCVECPKQKLSGGGHWPLELGIQMKILMLLEPVPRALQSAIFEDNLRTNVVKLRISCPILQECPGSSTSQVRIPDGQRELQNRLASLLVLQIKSSKVRKESVTPCSPIAGTPTSQQSTDVPWSPIAGTTTSQRSASESSPHAVPEALSFTEMWEMKKRKRKHGMEEEVQVKKPLLANPCEVSGTTPSATLQTSHPSSPTAGQTQAGPGSLQQPTSAPAILKAYLCPRGHKLKEFLSDGEHDCDKCLYQFAQGTIMHGCRHCDFDACCECVKTLKAAKASSAVSFAKETELAESHKQKADLETEPEANKSEELPKKKTKVAYQVHMQSKLADPLFEPGKSQKERFKSAAQLWTGLPKPEIQQGLGRPKVARSVVLRHTTLGQADQVEEDQHRGLKRLRPARSASAPSLRQPKQPKRSPSSSPQVPKTQPPEDPPCEMQTGALPNPGEQQGAPPTPPPANKMPESPDREETPSKEPVPAQTHSNAVRPFAKRRGIFSSMGLSQTPERSTPDVDHQSAAQDAAVKTISGCSGSEMSLPESHYEQSPLTGPAQATPTPSQDRAPSSFPQKEEPAEAVKDQAPISVPQNEEPAEAVTAAAAETVPAPAKVPLAEEQPAKAESRRVDLHPGTYSGICQRYFEQRGTSPAPERLQSPSPRSPSLSAFLGHHALSEKPGSPALPVQPGNPASLAQLGSPALPAQPGSPVPSAQPGRSVLLAQPGSPALLEQPGSPALSAQPGSPGLSVQPGSPALSAQPGSPGLSAQPGSPALSAQPESPGLSAQPGTPVSLAQPGERPASAQSETPSTVVTSSHLPPASAPGVAALPVTPRVSLAWLPFTNLQKNELKQRCRDLGLAQNGNKAELRARLTNHESAIYQEPGAGEAAQIRGRGRGRGRSSTRRSETRNSARTSSAQASRSPCLEAQSRERPSSSAQPGSAQPGGSLGPQQPSHGNVSTTRRRIRSKSRPGPEWTVPRRRIRTKSAPGPEWINFMLRSDDWRAPAHRAAKASHRCSTSISRSPSTTATMRQRPARAHPKSGTVRRSTSRGSHMANRSSRSRHGRNTSTQRGSQAVNRSSHRHGRNTSSSRCSQTINRSSSRGGRNTSATRCSQTINRSSCGRRGRNTSTSRGSQTINLSSGRRGRNTSTNRCSQSFRRSSCSRR